MEGEPAKKRGRKSNPDRKSLSALFGEPACHHLIEIMRSYPVLWTTRVTRNDDWRPVIHAMQSKYPDMEDEIIKRTWLNLLNGFIYRPERWKWRRSMKFVGSVIIPKYVEEAQNEANVSSSMPMSSMMENDMDEEEDDGLNDDGITMDENEEFGSDEPNASIVYNHMVNGVSNISYYPSDAISQNGGTSSGAGNDSVYHDSGAQDDAQMWQMYEPQMPMSSAPQHHPHSESAISQQLSAMASTLNSLVTQQHSGGSSGIDKLLAVLAQGLAPPKYNLGEMIRDRMEAVKSQNLRWQAERRILEAVDDIIDEFRAQ